MGGRVKFPSTSMKTDHKTTNCPPHLLLLPLITWFSTDLAVCLTRPSLTSWCCWCILAWIAPLSVSPWAILVIPMVFTTIPFHADSSQKPSGSSPYLLRPTPFNKPLGCLHPVSIGTLTQQQVCSCHFQPLWPASPIFLLRVLLPKIINLTPKPQLFSNLFSYCHCLCLFFILASPPYLNLLWSTRILSELIPFSLPFLKSSSDTPPLLRLRTKAFYHGFKCLLRSDGSLIFPFLLKWEFTFEQRKAAYSSPIMPCC